MKFLTFIISSLLITTSLAQWDEIDFSKVVPIAETLDAPQVIPNVRSRRIVGGVEVEPNSHPYHTALLLTMSATQISLCGGSVLSVSRTITAAHCVERAQSTTVVVGGHNIQTIEATQQRVTVLPANYRIHSGYSELMTIDQ
jgi:secreted trypsin-like serine protease